jgi:TRAP-type C4-dicarboxylate transport system substrate-binding protein
MKIPASGRWLLPTAFTLFALPVVAAEQWDMSAEQPIGNLNTQVAKDFAKDVRRATKGELDIRVYPNSVLVKRPAVKDAVRDGQIQMGEVFMSVLGKEDPLFELDALPFLATDYTQARKLWAVSRPAIEARLAKQGVRLLYAVPWPPQSLFTHKPLTRMADFSGMKLRSYNPLTTRLAQLLGATPVPATTAEIAGAFSSGAMEGMLTSPNTGVDIQVWKFAPYFYDLKAYIPKNIALVNEKAFARLSPANQHAVLQAAETAEVRGWELSWALTGYQVRVLSRQGVQINEQVPAEITEGLRGVGETMTREWLQRAGADGQQVIDAYRR